MTELNGQANGHMSKPKRTKGVRSIYKSGQCILAKYKGAGGDLIVGEIESVRANGRITGINLLTKKPFSKQEDVLSRRNVVCPRKFADWVVGVYLNKNSKAAARVEAIRLAKIAESSSSTNLARILHGTGEKTTQKSRYSQATQAALSAYSLLEHEERRDFLREVFPSFLGVFGIE